MQTSTAQFIVNPLTHRNIRVGGTRYRELKRKGMFDSSDNHTQVTSDSNTTTSDSSWSVQPIQKQQEKNEKEDESMDITDDEEFEFNWDD